MVDEDRLHNHGTRIAVVESEVDALKKAHQRFKDENGRQHQTIIDNLADMSEKMLNRLPLWATLGIGGLLATIGYLAK